MTSSLYLDLLDEFLRPGIAGLSQPFVEAQVRFVAGRQQSDGGFAGRQGGSDSYYTDFALRVLAWFAPGHEAFGRAADYLAGHIRPPRDIVECFSLLNTHRLLERGRADKPAVAATPVPGLDPVRLTEWLYGRLLPTGGFPRFADDPRVSAYHTFLGALCFQMLGVEMPAVEDAVLAVQSLGRPDGGYAELAGQGLSQTSATAAALAFLTMHEALPTEKIPLAARFLVEMQSTDGGLKPHAAVQGGDLLSTFTGLLTLSGDVGVGLSRIRWRIWRRGMPPAASRI